MPAFFLGAEMKVPFLLSIALVYTLHLGAQVGSLKTIDEIKRWHFQVQRGSVDIKLSSYAHAGHPRSTSLSFSLGGADSAATTSEEADLLLKVLQELPSLGYEPHHLELISTPLDGSELQEGVDLAVTKSGKWRSCIGFKYCYAAQQVANQFLKSVNAYKELDDVLGRYGLKKRRISMDDMACGTVAESAMSPANIREPSGVSCRGLIVIVVESN